LATLATLDVFGLATGFVAAAVLGAGFFD
jgi:hypothetical protein